MLKRLPQYGLGALCPGGWEKTTKLIWPEACRRVDSPLLVPRQPTDASQLWQRPWPYFQLATGVANRAKFLGLGGGYTEVVDIFSGLYIYFLLHRPEKNDHHFEIYTTLVLETRP